jgi:predicted nucleic acid-binding protein
MPIVIQSIQQVEVLVDALPHLMHLPIHLDVTTDAVALDFMAAYNLDAADAYHVAIARADGINSFVTLDQGFGVVDTLNLYTCDSVLLQNQMTATDLLPF